MLWTVSAPVFLVPERSEPVAAFTVSDWAGPNGVRVAGLDPADLPGATVHADGTVETPRLRLVGHFRAGRLELTRPPTVTDTWTPDPLLPSPLSWSALTGPFEVEDGDGSTPGLEDASVRAAMAYVEDQPDRGAVVRDDAGVLVVSFTGDLDRHRQEIRQVYGGRLALLHTEASWSELKAIHDRLHRELRDDGIGLFESRMIFDTLQAVVPAATPGQLAEIRRRHGFAAEPAGSDAPTGHGGTGRSNVAHSGIGRGGTAGRSAFQIASWLRPLASSSRR